MARALEWVRRHRRHIASLLLVVAGISLAVITGLRGLQTEDPPSAGELGLLLLVTSAFQVAAGIQLGRIGRVEATHARSAVRRLATVGQTIALMKGRVETATDGGDAASVRRTLWQIETGLGSVSAHLQDAVRDWQDAHPEAVREVIAEMENER